MKLAFSTLGVPGLPLDDVLALANAHGYHGVELRAHPEEPVHPGLGREQRADVAAQFKKSGVEVLGVAGYARVAAPGDDGTVLDEVRALVDLARDLGAPYVRVFPGGGEEQGPEEADATAARRLGVAAEYAADRGVRVLLETHDSHRTGAAASRILGLVGHRNVGALWDVMHTWLGGEQPFSSYAALSPYLGYVQVKDIAGAEDKTPIGLGAGVLPLGECVEVLSREGWDGWLCWEYEARWYPDAEALPGLLEAGREHLARLLTESA
ncbi:MULTISPECIES: sugar phosphate isomerase/epimerase [unclassified Streptomyces]|uniref:sugar phosphate isomerase/epimerase family protein n=1 Tax=unclassified Streptomyces TaxID=2593676 RepID=UPI00278BBD04|nr:MULTISPECIES: sugar phosphate isomerase/epimerase family protein [unclassified Streptomyces]